MGYFGLYNYRQSDKASDFHHHMFNSVIGDALLKECEVLSNAYNTDGVINVTLFLEELLEGKTKLYISATSDLYKALVICLDKIKILLDDAKKVPNDEWADKDMHIECFERMIANLTKYMELAK